MYKCVLTVNSYLFLSRLVFCSGASTAEVSQESEVNSQSIKSVIHPWHHCSSFFLNLVGGRYCVNKRGTGSKWTQLLFTRAVRLLFVYREKTDERIKKKIVNSVHSFRPDFLKKCVGWRRASPCAKMLTGTMQWCMRTSLFTSSMSRNPPSDECKP